MKGRKENKRNMTLDAARHEVLRYVDQGINYREISKKKFLIDGRVKKFNISEISKIKQQSTGQAINSKDKDPNAALVFELFKEGESPCDIVVKTQLSPDYVKEKYNKFQEMSEEMIFPEGSMRALLEIAGWMKGSKINDVGELQYYIEIAMGHFLEQEDGGLCDACENPGSWKQGPFNP